MKPYTSDHIAARNALLATEILAIRQFARWSLKISPAIERDEQIPNPATESADPLPADMLTIDIGWPLVQELVPQADLILALEEVEELDVIPKDVRRLCYLAREDYRRLDEFQSFGSIRPLEGAECYVVFSGAAWRARYEAGEWVPIPIGSVKVNRVVAKANHYWAPLEVES